MAKNRLHFTGCDRGTLNLFMDALVMSLIDDFFPGLDSFKPQPNVPE